MTLSLSHRIGLISDTHGQLRAGVHEALAGVEMILHAGDVGGEDILIELRTIAPVHAVAGNTDIPGEYDAEFAATIAGRSIHVSHGHEVGSPTPKKLADRYPHDVVVYGHTHQQLVTRIGERLIINPGAAGPRRFRLQASVAVLTIGETVDAEIIAVA
ncbi:MAG: metallophosphoesterase family protein [Gemmatimonadaceae bacterium]|nr:metallophosphoesterase family protein [Gemmatimonadaceae bacterium]